MGFTSELEELRGDIFKRIARWRARSRRWRRVPGQRHRYRRARARRPDKQLSEDFSEALGFIKSSIGKMDRLISAILNLTREGRREFEPVRIDPRTDRGHRFDRGASGRGSRGRRSGSNRCRTSSATALRWSRSSPI
jgi:hypothetical protein